MQRPCLVLSKKAVRQNSEVVLATTECEKAAPLAKQTNEAEFKNTLKKRRCFMQCWAECVLCARKCGLPSVDRPAGSEAIVNCTNLYFVKFPSTIFAAVTMQRCPSGPRGSTQVRMCSHSWVQIPLVANFFVFLRGVCSPCSAPGHVVGLGQVLGYWNAALVSVANVDLALSQA